MAEQTSRNRRIVRRALMAVLAVSLVLSMYVSSWFGLWWLWGRGWIDTERFVAAGETVFAPMEWWFKADFPPGGKTMWRWSRVAAAHGMKVQRRGFPGWEREEVVESRPPTGAARVPNVDIEGLGLFTPHFFDGDVDSFTTEIRFREQAVELIIYPSDDGAVPDAEDRAELKRMFVRFDERLAEALLALPSKLRPLCSEYRINVDQITDDQMISNLRWSNIKLEGDGTIECYTSNALVTESLDIVLGFSPESRCSDYADSKPRRIDSRMTRVAMLAQPRKSRPTCRFDDVG